jgi:hypothetical protein
MNAYRFRCAGLWIYLDGEELKNGRIVALGGDTSPDGHALAVELPGCQQCTLAIEEGCEVVVNAGVDLQLHCSNCGQVYILQDVEVRDEVKEPSGPNGTPVNCLKGMACPSCSQHEEFKIEAAAIFTVTDDGTDSFSDVAWCAESYVECPECGWIGTVKDLYVAGGKPVGKVLALPTLPPLRSKTCGCGEELDEKGFCPVCDELPEGM